MPKNPKSLKKSILSSPSDGSSEGMHETRRKIREQVADMDISLGEVNIGDVERSAKAFGALLKLTQALDEEDAKQAAKDSEKTQDEHTPYDQIPPPTDAEMRVIRDRLNSLYARLRAADDPELIPEQLKPE